MTPEPLSPEQRAERLWYRIENRLFAAGYTKEEPRGTFCRLQIADITTAIEEAVAAERERCVAICRRMEDCTNMTGSEFEAMWGKGSLDRRDVENVAAAIRREP